MQFYTDVSFNHAIVIFAKSRARFSLPLFLVRVFMFIYMIFMLFLFVEMLQLDNKNRTNIMNIKAVHE